MPGMFSLPNVGMLGLGFPGQGVRDQGTQNEWMNAYGARDDAQSQAEQDYLAQLEHELYARSRVREQPVLGPLEQLFAIPGYTAAKAAGLVSGRSTPGVDEMAAGYRGLTSGLEANIGDVLNSFTGAPAPVAQPPAMMPLSQQMTPEQLRAYLGYRY